MTKNYNIHNLVRVKTDVNTHLPDQFEVKNLTSDPDIEIKQKELDFKKAEDNEILRRNYHYWRESNKLLIDYGFGAKLVMTKPVGKTKIKYTKALKRWATKERWETLLKAVLSIKLLEKGYTLVHSGGLSVEEKGLLITGMQNSGKTSTVLSLLDGDNFKFMGDDMIILSSKGKVYSYPMKVRISPKTLTGNAISYRETLKDKLLKNRVLSIFAERFLQEDIKNLQKIPNKLIVDDSPLSKIFLLCGYGKRETKKVPTERAVNAISTTTMGPLDLCENYLEIYYHLFDVNVVDLLTERQKIIEKALGNTDCFMVTATNLEGYSDAIRERIKSEK